MARKKQRKNPALLGWLAKLGDEVARLRGEKGHTQESLAKQIGMARSQLSIIETGSRSYGIYKLLAILMELQPNPTRSLLEIASRLDVVDDDAARAVGNLVFVLNSKDPADRADAIRLVRSLRRDRTA